MTLFKNNEKQIQTDYFKFLSFKSVASEAAHKQDSLDCADWLVNYLSGTPKLNVELWDTDFMPCLFAEYNGAGPDKPTLLFYGHYDVQPVDPIELWDSPPFEATEVGGDIYARGAQDNKGQCFYTMSAIKYALETNDSLPVNVKLLIEGEEEIGSPSLPKLLAEQKNRLNADYLLIVDLGFRDKQELAISLSTRGITSLTVNIKGSETDLHSGVHGGIAYNPLRAMTELFAKFRDENGKITIPGFLDDVVEIDREELSGVVLDFDPQTYSKAFGAEAVPEKGYTIVESSCLRPTLEINGIGGGYFGDGLKTVIPSGAVAKISCRLVPNQEPELIQKAIAKFIKENIHPSMQVEVTLHPGSGKGVMTKPDAKILQICKEAYEEVNDQECLFILQGATIPIVPELADVSEAEVALLGYALPSDKIHAPNEHFGWDRFEKGFLSTLKILEHAAN